MTEVTVELEEGVTMNEDGSITIELSEPIVRDHERIEAITLRRPRVGDVLDVSIKLLEEGNFREGAKLVCILSGLSAREVNGLDMGDFTVITRALGRLFPRRPRRPAR